MRSATLRRRRPARGSIEQSNRLVNERVEGRNGSGCRGEQVQSGEVVPRQRHPELAIELFAVEHGETTDLVRLTVQRGRVLVGVGLPQPILSDSKRLGDRQDSPVEQAEVRLQLGREPHGLGTNGSDLSQEPQRDLALRHVVQDAERDDGARTALPALAAAWPPQSAPTRR